MPGPHSTGLLILPDKSGAGWIYIQSSAHDSLPLAGTRVKPSDTPHMRRLVTIGSPHLIRVAQGAHQGSVVQTAGRAPGLPRT